MSVLVQSRTDVYVVVRDRETDACTLRLGAFKASKVGKHLAKAIEAWPSYRVVVEPVEFHSPPMLPPPKKGSDVWYVRQARIDWQKEGEIEIDDDAKISRGDDPGAYVAAWVWVHCEMEEDDGE